ncbi:MAG: glycosyltransferase family 39 protein, partial [Verrucomicrobiota bacterium]
MSENPKTRSFSYLGIAVCIITLLTVLRFWYAQTIELVGDEAYYWQWSKHLDWSYYSKGPGVALTIMGGTWFFGDTVLGVRFFAVLLSAGTALGIYTLGRLLFSDKVGFFALLFVMSIPLFALGGVLMTIDPLSVFFWVWSCVAFWMALQSRRLLWWVLAGLLIGAGMLAKYTNVVLLISFLVFLVFSSRDRKVLNFVNYLLMTTITVLCMAPVYIWNKINEWITIEHLLHRGGLDSSFTVNVFEAFYFLLMQAVGVSQFIWL